MFYRICFIILMKLKNIGKILKDIENNIILFPKVMNHSEFSNFWTRDKKL